MPNVHWTDGKKVRAQDFEYAWKRLLNPKTASQYAYILFDLVNAQEYNQGKIKDPAAVGVRTKIIVQPMQAHDESQPHSSNVRACCRANGGCSSAIAETRHVPPLSNCSMHSLLVNSTYF